MFSIIIFYIMLSYISRNGSGANTGKKKGSLIIRNKASIFGRNAEVKVF